MDPIVLAIIILVGLIVILGGLRYYFRRKSFEVGEEVLIDNQFEGYVVEVHDKTVTVRVELPNHLVTKKP